MLTSPELLDHQDTSSLPGPTPRAPASGANFQVPSTPSGITSFTSLKDQCPPFAISMSNSKVFPSSERVTFLLMELQREMQSTWEGQEEIEARFLEIIENKFK